MPQCAIMRCIICRGEVLRRIIVRRAPILEIAEHNKLMQFTGGKPVKSSNVVSNKVDPVGSKRLEQYNMNNNKI